MAMIPLGVDIVVSHYWPKEKPVIGTFVSRAHPFVEWLAKFFRFDPNTYFENVEIGKTWNDPILTDRSLITFGGGRGKIILCSQEQADLLRTTLK